MDGELLDTLVDILSGGHCASSGVLAERVLVPRAKLGQQLAEPVVLGDEGVQ
jgi:hypothetical protein